MITENFIKMCEMAEEIQKAWKPVDWDRFIYKDDREFGIACVDDKGYQTKKAVSYRLKHYVWLPIQEQLWEMLPEIKDKVHVLFRFNKFLSGRYINESYHVAFLVLTNMPSSDEEDMSISELLFAFVMKEKYHKVWTGKDWKKIKENK